MQWLGRDHPELVDKYNQLYTSAYAPVRVSQVAGGADQAAHSQAWPGARQGGDRATGGVRSSALGMAGLRNGNGERPGRSLISEELAPGTAAQPTLF